MKRFIAAALLTAVFAIVLCSAIYASPGDSDYYVDDRSGVISDEVTDYIVKKNNALFALTGAEIVIVTVEGTGGKDMASYTMDLFNSKKIGDKSRNNGILLVMTTGDAKNYYLLPGCGIEKDITRDYMKGILNSVLEPEYKDADYDGGAKAIVDALAAKFEGIYGVSLSEWNGTAGSFERGGKAGASSDGLGVGDVLGIIFIIIIVVLIFLLIFARPIAVYLSQRQNPYKNMRPAKRPSYGASPARRPANGGRPAPDRTNQGAPRGRAPQQRPRNPSSNVGNDGFVYPDGVTPPAPKRPASTNAPYSSRPSGSRNNSGESVPSVRRPSDPRGVNPSQSAQGNTQPATRRNRIMNNMDEDL